MASPAGGDLPNGISTPPTTAPGATNSPSSTQPNTQTASQPSQLPHLSNGQTVQTQVNPSQPPTSLTDPGTSKRPRDARLIHLLLANMGVHAYTERVPLQLLDFSYRYTSGILSDAIAYEPPVPVSTSKKSKNDDGEGITLNAVRTAILSRASYTMAGVLPKEFMAEIASERNRIALPRVEKEFGVRLPPERYCFTGVGWGVREAWEDEAEDGEEGEAAGAEAAGVGVGGPVTLDMDIDTEMGGVDEEDEDGEEEFEEVMGLKGDTDMVNG